jgi:hypothetical protein
MPQVFCIFRASNPTRLIAKGIIDPPGEISEEAKKIIAKHFGFALEPDVAFQTTGYGANPNSLPKPDFSLEGSKFWLYGEHNTLPIF